jgi:hypothetical protein
MMRRSPAASAPVVELALGTIVYDGEGEQVGRVICSTLRTGYVVVQQGGLLTRDLSLPPGALHLREEDWIKLRLFKEEVKQEQWKSPPPEQRQGASPRAMAEESEAMTADSAAHGRMRRLPPDEMLPPAVDQMQRFSEEALPPLANR